MTFDIGSSVIGVENIIKYNFEDPSILWEALQAPGSGVLMSGNRVLSTEGNKRLALVGDAWLKMAIITEWSTENLRTADGENRMQARAKNKNLAKICKLCGLDRFINQNPSQQGVLNRTIRSDALEAIIGAVAIDGGLEAVLSVLRTLGLLAMERVPGLRDAA